MGADQPIWVNYLARETAFAIADFLFAAWFLWMTPLLAALSSRVFRISERVGDGVLVSPDQLHLCMCYTPIRYAWDLQHQYLRESGMERGLKGLYARRLLHRLRQVLYYRQHKITQRIAGQCGLHQYSKFILTGTGNQAKLGVAAQFSGNMA